MTAPDELAVARRIVQNASRRLHLNDPHIMADMEQIALAAIQATTEAAAAFIERGTFLPCHASERHPIRAADALRANLHLKGTPSHG